MNDSQTARRAHGLLEQMLRTRLTPEGAAWLREAVAEIARGVDDTRFGGLISLASRHCRGGALAPSPEERAAAGDVVVGWEPAFWTQLEAARVVLVLARADLGEDAGARAIEEAFRYADVGELCALYRSLAFLPRGERMLLRAREGLRSNMTAVFVAAACDGPYPATQLDELGWNQMVVKALFVGAPLWRVFGLDERLSPELARMALDLCEERRSAGRPVPHELWLCLGTHGGERGLAALQQELDPSNSNVLGRRAAAYGMARAGCTAELERLVPAERDPRVAAALRDALAGNTSQRAFEALDPASTT